MSFINSLTFFIIRTFIIALALFLAWYLVNKYIKPNILEPQCLIDTENCIKVNLFKLKNSFLANILPENTWLWFDGSKLYIYNQSPNECDDPTNFEEVVVIKPSIKNNQVSYKREPNECVLKISVVINDYKLSTQLLYNPSSKVVTALDIFEQLCNDGYVSIQNVL